MTRGFIGFVVGALVAAGLLRAVESRRADAGVKGSAAPADAVSDVTEEERLRASLGETEAAIRELESRVTAPAAPLDARPAGPAHSTARLGPALAAALVADDWIWDYDDKRAQDIGFELQAILLAYAKELGISLGEAEFGPGGIAALQIAMLEALDPPPDEAARARMAQAMEKLKEGWAAYLTKRGGLTNLEQYAELSALSGEFGSAVDGVLSADQQNLRENLGDIWSSWSPSQLVDSYVQVTSGQPSLAGVTDEWTRDWSARLGVDDSESRMLRPIVEDYVREIAELNTEVARRRELDPKAPGPSFDEHFALMLKAQKRLADLGLSAEQRKALRAWGTVMTHDRTAER